MKNQTKKSKKTAKSNLKGDATIDVNQMHNESMAKMKEIEERESSLEIMIRHKLSMMALDGKTPKPYSILANSNQTNLIPTAHRKSGKKIGPSTCKSAKRIERRKFEGPTMKAAYSFLLQ